jgi:hypothetical protein
MLKGFILCVLILSLLIPASIVSAASKITVVLDGDSVRFDIQPFIDSSSRTMVPIRMISQEMGAYVDWNSNTNVVTIKQDKKTILLKIGESKATVDGKTIKLDTKAIAKSGRTFVPLRFVSEALGASVSWDGRYRIIYITTKGEIETISNLEKMIKSLESFSGTITQSNNSGSILINLKGTNDFYDNTIRVTDDKNKLRFTFYSLEAGEKALLLELLQKYYPTDYQEAYNTIIKKQRIETVYEDRNFECYYVSDSNVYVVSIGLG